MSLSVNSCGFGKSEIFTLTIFSSVVIGVALLAIAACAQSGYISLATGTIKAFHGLGGTLFGLGCIMVLIQSCKYKDSEDVTN